MASIAELLSYSFMRNALLVGVLASLLCGVIGTLVVVKRLVFISGGISHAAFGGLGACYFFGLEPRLGGIAVAVLAALFLGGSGGEHARPHDAMIGVLWAVGMAIGIVFIYKTPGFAPNLMTYLFGNILLVARADVIAMLALDAAVLLVLGLFFKEFVAVAFDEEFSRVQGVAVRPLLALLMVLIAVSVVLLIQVVGIVLVIALLTIPPLIGLALLRDLLSVIVASVAAALLMTLGGLWASYQYDVPSGPAIVLLGALLMGLTYAARRWSQRPLLRRAA